MSKAPLVLLINPWITDFAAFDLWAKPMGLLILASLLKQGGCGVHFIDCLDRHDPLTNRHPDVFPGADKKFGTGKYPKMPLERPGPYAGFPRYFYRHGIHPESMREKLRGAGRPDLVWVTSSMTYWYPGAFEAVGLVREQFPDVPVWLGGIYARLCPRHAAENSGADRVFTGKIAALPDLIASATGFEVQNRISWTDFSLQPPPALELVPGLEYAPVMTSLGCPFRCPYCASGVLQPEWKRAGPERIYADIARAHALFGITDFAFYDDALLLGAEASLKPALERVVRDRLPVRFHVPNALHIRALSPEWCGLLRASGFRTIRLGLETTADERNRGWGGKVDTGMFLRGVENLLAAGFDGNDIGVYLLCGAPGQTPVEVAEAVETVKRAGVRPRIAEYSPIPGTPMWADAAAGCEFDLEGEPLYHNNTFFACRRPDFTYEDMLALKRVAREVSREDAKARRKEIKAYNN